MLSPSSHHRARERGLTLMEVVLVLMIGAVMALSLAQFTEQSRMEHSAAAEARLLAVLTEACQRYVAGNYAALIKDKDLARGTIKRVEIFSSRKGDGSVQGEGYLPPGIAGVHLSEPSPLERRYYLLVRTLKPSGPNKSTSEGRSVPARVVVEGVVVGEAPMAIKEDMLARIAHFGGPSIGFIRSLDTGDRPAGSIVSPSGSWYFPKGSWGELSVGNPVGYVFFSGAPGAVSSGSGEEEPWLARKLLGDASFNRMSVDLNMNRKKVRNARTVATDRLTSLIRKDLAAKALGPIWIEDQKVYIEGGNMNFIEGSGLLFASRSYKGMENDKAYMGPYADIQHGSIRIQRGGGFQEGGDVVVAGGDIRVSEGGTVRLEVGAGKTGGDRVVGNNARTNRIGMANSSVNMDDAKVIELSSERGITMGKEHKWGGNIYVKKGNVEVRDGILSLFSGLSSNSAMIRFDPGSGHLSRSEYTGLVDIRDLGDALTLYLNCRRHSTYLHPGMCLGATRSNRPAGITIHSDVVARRDVSVEGMLYAPHYPKPSDRRLKTDIDPISPVESLSNILSLKPVSFRWKDSARIKGDNGRKHLGFVAQDVENVISELVTGGEGQSSKGLDYSGLVAPVVGAVQELYARFRTFTQTLQKKLNNMAALIGKNTQNIEAIRKELVDVKALSAQVQRDNSRLQREAQEFEAALLKHRPV